MGFDRIKRNLGLNAVDVVEYCKIKFQIRIVMYTIKVITGIEKPVI